MNLNIFERLSLLQILPQKGDFMTLKIVTNLQQVLSPSEEEFKEFGLKEVQGRYEWNNKGQEPKEIEIGDKAKKIVAEELKKLSDSEELNMNLFSVYNKFIEDKKEKE